MSQAGIVDIEGSHPQIPTMFVTNNGTAIPIANTIEILGEAVPATGIPVQTVGSGNTIEINVQRADAAAASFASNAGLASFNSTDFTVDSNGYVTLLGSATAESFEVDTSTPPGTNPVVPNGSGLVTVTGGQVAAGTTTNIIQTNSLSANTYTIQVQRSKAVASSTIGDNGVSHFDSAFFTVDANGFVSIIGSSVDVTINGDTGPGATGNTFTFNAQTNNGITSVFNASGSTIDLITSDANTNMLFGLNCGNAFLSANGSQNTAFGIICLTAGTTASNNSAFAQGALGQTTSSSYNCAFGFNALGILTSGSGNNTAIGLAAGNSISTGSYNIFIGAGAGSGNTLADSNNILIGNDGVASESNAIRIGTQGSSTGQQNACYIAGIASVSVSNTQMVTINTSTGQMGSRAIPSTMSWSDNSGTFTAVVSNGYFITAASTPTMPASPSEGDVVEFIVDTASTCTITGNTGQKIRLGAALSAAAGTCANNARGDTISLVYRSTGTTWFTNSSTGTWTVT